MDILKFRAWDTFNEQYYYSENYKNLGDFFTKMQHLIEGKNGLIFQQFIGLHDKNGKEIYEGDVLCNNEYQTWEWRGVVKFSHGVFGAEWLMNVKSQSMVGSWGQKHNLRKLDDDIIERQIVIGNIYQNPELLKK